MSVYVNNISSEAKAYVVARSYKGQLWYWGSWDDETKAIEVANEVNGIVVYNN